MSQAAQHGARPWRLIVEHGGKQNKANRERENSTQGCADQSPTVRSATARPSRLRPDRARQRRQLRVSPPGAGIAIVMLDSRVKAVLSRSTAVTITADSSRLGDERQNRPDQAGQAQRGAQADIPRLDVTSDDTL